MAISYPITLPLTGMVTNMVFTPLSAVAPVPSEFNFKSQVQAWGGQAWMIDVVIRPGPRADMEPLVAALTSLNNQEGSFYLGDTANRTPRGAATGTPLVKGASQTGYDLITDGWTAGVTGILKKGDWIEVTQASVKRLHKLMLDADSNGLGEATLTIWPKLRASPADNAAVVTSSPVSKFMLASKVSWGIDAGKIYAVSFSAVEDLRA